MKKITFKDRIRYHFDNVMSKGPIALIGWLFIASAVLIALNEEPIARYMQLEGESK